MSSQPQTPALQLGCLLRGPLGGYVGIDKDRLKILQTRLSHSDRRSGLAPQSRTAFGMTVTCCTMTMITDFDAEPVERVGVDNDGGSGGVDDGVGVDGDDDVGNIDDLSGIDAEPVEHVGKLASLFLKLVGLQSEME